MQFVRKSNLPFVTVSVTHAGQTVTISDVLIDTGSAATILAIDSLAPLGIQPEPNDTLYNIRGVGGSEVVFLRRIDVVTVGNQALNDFEIEVGGMDYGFEINGILGMDYLTTARATISLADDTIVFG